MNEFYKYRREMEKTINDLLASIAKNLRKAIASGDTAEVERILKLLDTGLELEQ